MRLLSTASLLIAVIITAQLSCTQRRSTESPTASPSRSEQAVVDQILQRYEQALGGKDAIDAITSQKMKGRFQLAGMTGNVEVWRKEPNKTLTVVEFPRIGTLRKGLKTRRG